MTFKQIIKQVAKELNLPEDLVRNTYKSYWKVIKQIIERNNIKSNDNLIFTSDEFNNNVININVPSIGKLNCTYDKYLKTINRFNLINNIKHREDVKEYVN